MNMKFGLLLAGLGASVLTACVIEQVDCATDPTNALCIDNVGGGGVGGAGGEAGAGVGGAGGAAGQGGAGGAAACVGCAEFSTEGNMAPLCMGASTDLYTAVSDCACNRGSMDAMPGCKDACEKDRCAGMPSSAECDACLATGLCAKETAACVNDL